MKKYEIKELVASYCLAKQTSSLAKLKDIIGLEAASKLCDVFLGKVVAIPTKNSMRRIAIPLIIDEWLSGLLAGSEEYKAMIRKLSKAFRLPKRAVKQMAKTGKYCR